jgi:ATP-dependent exoDNAse (exonuclease V) beta subunit
VLLAGELSPRYEAFKRAAGVLDFDDLQVLAVELLETRPEIASRYRERFRLVMIDEFQDTDALQLRLVKALSANDLCTVGDEKQSIYRFRGADIDVYRAHRAEMQGGGALTVRLGVNYRSHRDVLSFVNAVFSSPEYFDGDLLRLVPPTDPREPQARDIAFDGHPRIEALFVDSSGFGTKSSRRAEAREIARRLRDLAAEGVGAGDMAILVRAYSNAHVYAEALADVGLPAVIVGGSRFFGLAEVAILRALTRAIANPSDGEAIGALLVSEFCPVSDDGLARLRLGANAIDPRPLWELMRDERGRLGVEDLASATRLVSVIEQARSEIATRPLADIVLNAVEEAGWDLRLLSRGNVGRDAFANVLKFARLAETFEASGHVGPAAFAAYLDAKESLGDVETPASVADDEAQAVRIMSVHASKGLEFPVVVVPDLASRVRGGGSILRVADEDGRLRVALLPPPTDDGVSLPRSSWAVELSTLDDEAQVEEGDRVLYVAFTRARDLLIVSGSADLRPKSVPKSKSHLHRLARILGVDVPIGGPSDVEVALDDAGESVSVCVRVIDGVKVLAEVPEAGEVAAYSCADPGPTGPRFETITPMSVVPTRTSYSRLHVFEQCPRRYLLEDVVGFRRSEMIEPGEVEPTRFGSALHALLQLAFDGVLPADERIKAISRQFELDLEGSTRLRAAAESFLSSRTARRAAGADRVARELSFALPIASGACILAGSVDLYARTGSSALVVDYKSGVSGDEADLQDRYALQASCYAVAALADGADEVEVVFTRPEVLTADGTPQEVSYHYGRRDETALRDRIDGIYSRIESDDFRPLGARDERLCGSCPAPTGLCPNARL